jgi:hypothetical protein
MEKLMLFLKALRASPKTPKINLDSFKKLIFRVPMPIKGYLTFLNGLN